MAGATSTSGGGATVPRHYAEESEVTGWVGWIVFAGTMMMLLGVFHMFEGLTALFRHAEIAFPTSGLTIQVSYTSWGWLQLIAGVLVFLAGLGLFTGRMWARVLGVILVAISALVNFAHGPRRSPSGRSRCSLLTSWSSTRSSHTAQR
jgi:vacuolar-type H+-ATPase subunit I/STV1